MDRREAIKAGASALAIPLMGAPSTVDKGAGTLTYTMDFGYDGGLWTELRGKWRIVDQMIEEHGDGET